jgi:hypothetical protein
MKNFLIHLLLFISYSISFKTGYALKDSLPGCINEMKISTESFVTEYEYKGQRWFVFTKNNPPPEPNVSDRMTNTTFYNSDCKIVGWWTKGGIAGLNKVTPDTIEKSKIKKIGIVPKDTIIKQNASSNALPDSIVKLALAKNCSEVKEYLYQDKILYNFRYPLNYREVPKEGSVTIDVPYYDKNGKVILIYKSAIKGMYKRAERWVPAIVKRDDVTEVPNCIWLREKNTYRKFTNPK